MNWTKIIISALVCLNILIWFNNHQESFKQPEKLSLYTPVDTMNCKFTYIDNNNPKHNQKGYMILMNQGDSINIKAFVVDSDWKTIDCNTILKLDINHN